MIIKVIQGQDRSRGCRLIQRTWRYLYPI